MRDIEYPPLLPDGFKEIQESELHSEFVSNFYHGSDLRADLVRYFNQFIDRFKELGLTAEVWIDGSFATTAPDPSDIDVVFYFESEAVDNLEKDKRKEFEILFKQRRMMKNIYKLDVHYGIIGNEEDYEQWKRTFGTCYNNTTPKGIFRMFYNG